MRSLFSILVLLLLVAGCGDDRRRGVVDTGVAADTAPAGDSAPPGDSATDGASDTGAMGCDPAEGTLVGQCAPDFTLPAADGSTFTLSEQRGAPVLVHVVAAWAAPSLTSSAAIEATRGDYPEVVFVDVLYQDAMTEPATATAASDWRDSLGLGYPVLYDDTAGFGEGWAEASLVPIAVVIDASGVVTSRIEGSVEGQLAAALDGL